MNKEYVLEKLAQKVVTKNEETTVKPTGKEYGSNTWKKDGASYSAVTKEYDTPNGKRLYTGTGKSKDYLISQDKASFNATQKAGFEPADSTRYSEVPNIKDYQFKKIQTIK